MCYGSVMMQLFQYCHGPSHMFLLLSCFLFPVFSDKVVTVLDDTEWVYHNEGGSFLHLQTIRLTSPTDLNPFIVANHLPVTVKVTLRVSVQILSEYGHTSTHNTTIEESTFYNINAGRTTSETIDTVTFFATFGTSGGEKEIQFGVHYYSEGTSPFVYLMLQNATNPTFAQNDLIQLDTQWALRPVCAWNSNKVGKVRLPAVVRYRYVEEYGNNRLGNHFSVELSPHFRNYPEWDPFNSVAGASYVITCDRVELWHVELQPIVRYTTNITRIVGRSMGLFWTSQPPAVSYTGFQAVDIQDANGITYGYGWNTSVVLQTYDRIHVGGNFVDPKGLSTGGTGGSSCSLSNIHKIAPFTVTYNKEGYSQFVVDITPNADVLTPNTSSLSDFASLWLTCNNYSQQMQHWCTSPPPDNDCSGRTNLVYKAYDKVYPPAVIGGLLASWRVSPRGGGYYSTIATVVPADGVTMDWQTFTHKNGGTLCEGAAMFNIVNNSNNNNGNQYYLVYGNLTIPENQLLCMDVTAHHNEYMMLQLKDSTNPSTSCFLQCSCARIDTINVTVFKNSSTHEMTCSWEAANIDPLYISGTYMPVNVSLMVDDGDNGTRHTVGTANLTLRFNASSWYGEYRLPTNYEAYNLNVTNNNKSISKMFYLAVPTFSVLVHYKGHTQSLPVISGNLRTYDKSKCTLGNAVWKIEYPSNINVTAYKHYDFVVIDHRNYSVMFFGFWPDITQFETQKHLFAIDYHDIEYHCHLTARNDTYHRILQCDVNFYDVLPIIKELQTVEVGGTYLTTLTMYLNSDYAVDGEYITRYIPVKINVEGGPPCGCKTELIGVASGAAGIFIFAVVVLVVFRKKPDLYFPPDE